MNEDLISREAVIKMLREKADSYVVSMFATSDECRIARIVALEAAEEVSHMPAVDVKPVKRGGGRKE